MSNVTDKTTALNPFDPAALRLNSSYAETIGVKKLLTTVPVRKPTKQEFVRVHSDPLYRVSPIAIIELKEDSETYLVPPAMACELSDEVTPVSLFTAINRQNVLFLWPVKLPSADGRANSWHESQAAAAERAMTRWTKVRAKMSLGAYEIFEAVNDLPDPEWPDVPFDEILRIAFRDHIVESSDHPVVKRLRGET